MGPLALLTGLPAHLGAAQAPELLWTTNVGAQLFAVDAQTNVYANTGSQVIKLNSAGVPVATNAICPVGGLAQRDAEGNYYFAGIIYASQDFGGITLPVGVGGQCYVAKYNPAGALLWAANFGFFPDRLTDCQLDADGNLYVGFTYSLSHGVVNGAKIAKFSPLGTEAYEAELLSSGIDRIPLAVRFGGLSSTTGLVVVNVQSSFSSYTLLFQFDGASGTPQCMSTYGISSQAASSAARPVLNANGEYYNVENRILYQRTLTGATNWTRDAGVAFTLGSDYYGGVHVADSAGALTRYDVEGNAVWSLNLPAVAKAMVVDGQGNRFVSLTNGVIARLADEAVLPLSVINGPQSQTVLVGSNVVFSVECSGTRPVHYSWLHNGSVIPEATGSSLALTNVPAADAGLYWVIISNLVNSVTSSPALLRVKSVGVFAGEQLLTNGTYTFSTPPTLSVRSVFANGSIYYTLDGSAPYFGSTAYQGPFTLSQSATVRVLAYSADFSQSEEADAVTAVMLTRHTLTATTPGGGSVVLNPAGGNYLSTNVVTATAVPLPGWSFLGWLGDASGSNTVTAVSMENDKTLQAVFGTVLSTTVAGNGQVLLDPSGGTYPYGTTVRLTAAPQAGNYFGAWGNAASGNTNPLEFTLTNATPTVSSVFAAVPGGQAALVVRISGAGRVSLSPQANVYTLGQSVTLTAIPNARQRFVGWGGDASGAQNPLSVSMNQSKSITATFTSEPDLSAAHPALTGFGPGGFRLTLTAPLATAWQILGSTDLSSWESLGVVTNSLGQVQFTDSVAGTQSRRFYRAVANP